MKGQISIEYTAGALLFFSAILFVVSGVLGTLPRFTDTIDENSIETEAWTLSTLLISTQGRWESGPRSGTQWQQHTGNISRVGLLGQDGSLEREKIRAFVSLRYERLKVLLKTGKDLNIEFTEFVVADTSQSFTKPTATGDIGTVLTQPDSQAYQDANATVHYGTVTLNGDERHFLVTAHQGVYDTIYISQDWNFTDAIRLGPNGNRVLSFNGRRYRIQTSESGIFQSNGQTVIFSRPMGRVGRRTPTAEPQIINVRRFASMDGKPVRIDMEIWE
ncbi:MAG: hypothetical protein SV186_03050 [Candidatus Nanohaloarchaea archaeon]|nr:hypothetical protein [Candidatus Nanohaloarchaea archaeon]